MTKRLKILTFLSVLTILFGAMFLMAPKTTSTAKADGENESPETTVKLYYTNPEDVFFRGDENITIDWGDGTFGEGSLYHNPSHHFQENSGRVVITIYGLTRISSSMFNGDTALESVNIGNGIKSIGASSFSGCSNLTSVILPESLNRIGNYAFYDCAALESVVIPKNVIFIGEGAFQACGAASFELYSAIPPEISVNAFADTDDCPIYVDSAVISEYFHVQSWSPCFSRLDSFGHKAGEWIEEIPATCNSAGVKGHYLCDVCGAVLDEELEELDDLTSPATGHSFVWVEEVPATTSSTGVRGHFHCDKCGKDFDRNYNETTAEALTIPKVVEEQPTNTVLDDAGEGVSNFVLENVGVYIPGTICLIIIGSIIYFVFFKKRR